MAHLSLAWLHPDFLRGIMPLALLREAAGGVAETDQLVHRLLPGLFSPVGAYS